MKSLIAFAIALQVLFGRAATIQVTDPEVSFDVSVTNCVYYWRPAALANSTNGWFVLCSTNRFPFRCPLPGMVLTPGKVFEFSARYQNPAGFSEYSDVLRWTCPATNKLRAPSIAITN